MAIISEALGSLDQNGELNEKMIMMMAKLTVKPKESSKKIVKKRKSKKIKVGDKVIVICENVKSLKNSSILFKTGIVIGESAVKKNKLCIEFTTSIAKGHSGNSGRFTGKPFQCFYVISRHLKPYSKEVFEDLKVMKENKVQEEIDNWYPPEERYF